MSPKERVLCTTYYKLFLGSDREWGGKGAGRGSREDGSVQEQDIIVLPGLEVEGKEMRKGYN